MPRESPTSTSGSIFARLLQVDLAIGILHLVHHGNELEQFNLADLFVVVGFQIARVAEFLVGGSQDSLFERLQNDPLLDPLLLDDLVDGMLEAEARFHGSLLQFFKIGKK